MTVGESFPKKRPLRQNQLMVKMKSGALFGYSQGDLKFSEYLRERHAKFSSIFKIPYHCRQSFCPPMQENPVNKSVNVPIATNVNF